MSDDFPSFHSWLWVGITNRLKYLATHPHIPEYILALLIMVSFMLVAMILRKPLYLIGMIASIPIFVHSFYLSEKADALKRQDFLNKIHSKEGF